MEVKVISKENIKPSSPTPDHLKTLEFSLLDQLMQTRYNEIILFYPNIIDISSHLKKSLSETLPRFYPLAGKIKDELSIDCNDEGVNFVETRVNCNINDFLSKPNITLLRNFLPCELDPRQSIVGTHVANIQVNVFECGGIALGLCISHKIVDGAGMATFVRAWAGTTRNGCSVHETSSIVATYPGPSLFPAKAKHKSLLQDGLMAMSGSMVKLGRPMTRRFVFNASVIADLKAQAKTSSVQHPTRVEVVTACLWKSAMKASTQVHGSERPSLVCHAVNLRRRASPPIPEHSLGNFVVSAAAKHYKSNDHDHGMMKGLVSELRNAMSRVDGKFIEKMRSDQGLSVMEEGIKEKTEFGANNGPADYFVFSSWCKFGFYDDADFGWGRPLWVSPGIGKKDLNPMVVNTVILADTRSGDGVEAWVILHEQDMAIMERDQELLSLDSLDPSPLHY